MSVSSQVPVADKATDGVSPLDDLV